MKLRPRSLLSLLTLLLVTSCSSVLTKWHDDSYVALLAPDDPELALHDGEVELTEGPDLEGQAEALYAEGYLMIGYSKFTHTLVPTFNAMYAKMYGERIGAEIVMQETPRKVGSNVFAYTVTYWARGRDFPFGAYYNDVPDDVRMYYPDSLREFLGDGRPVLVETVVRDSPAAGAGVARGELVIGLDGAPIAGAEDLDARLRERSGERVELTLWSAAGMRTTELVLGDVATFAGADIPGAEAHFYRNPWAIQDYQDFSYISEAFATAWHGAIEAYQAQAEAERQRAYEAWQNSRISALEDGPSAAGMSEREARARGLQPTRRMGLGIGGGPGFNMSGGFGSGLDQLGPGYASLMSSWYFTHKSMFAPTVVFNPLNAPY